MDWTIHCLNCSVNHYCMAYPSLYLALKKHMHQCVLISMKDRNVSKKCLLSIIFKQIGNNGSHKCPFCTQPSSYKVQPLQLYLLLDISYTIVWNILCTSIHDNSGVYQCSVTQFNKRSTNRNMVFNAIHQIHNYQ